MRSNLFLHFLNRDSREIFELHRFYSAPQHTSLLKQALNAAILICEDHCVIPPGFAIEDEIAFDLSELNREYFSEKRILLPMRESSLADYAEKKRIEYSPQRDRYSGLFSDRRLEFLGANAVGLVKRRSHIAEEIVKGWEAAPDSKNRLWVRSKKLLTARTIEAIRQVPNHIAGKGYAVTWSQIQELLPLDARASYSELRNSLQNIYFRQYCREFDLKVLSELPFRCDEFGLPTERLVYSFTRFSEFLDVFYLRRLLLRCSSATICEVKRTSGLTRFVDAYQGIARATKSRAGLRLIGDRALRACRFDWKRFEARHELLLSEPHGLALAEMDDALTEVANLLTEQNGIPIRRTNVPKAATQALDNEKDASSSRRTAQVTRMPDLVIYVALTEELDVLAKHWRLERPSVGPAARGTVTGVAVDVLSPMTMGRVPAAVEVTKYLENRKVQKPKLILILGLAGGFREQGTQEGHIICGTVVVDLASRKVQDTEKETVTRFRRRDYNLESSLERVLKSSSFNSKEWQDAAIEGAEWPEGLRPSLHYGAIASLDEVVASATWSKKLLESTEKLLGVEMEAGGVCAAAEVFRVPVGMLRAVSDNADPVKADTKWRRIGMKTIAMLVDRLSFDEIFRAMAQ